MRITFYGTRGSIAVAHKETTKYGGNTTCLFVESKRGDAIVVDAGTGIRKLGVDLLRHKKDVLHLVFTHYHWDHIQGFPFFAPLFLKDKTIEVYGSKKEATAKRALIYQMTKPYFPAALDGLPAAITFKNLASPTKIGGIVVETIVNNHPDYTVGLKFTEGKNSFVFLTDNELFATNSRTPYKRFVSFVRGARYFAHDAQYTDDMYDKRIGWGHSTFSQVLKLAYDSGVKNVVFTHHDHGSTDRFIDCIVASLRREHRRLNIQAAAEGKTITLN